MLKPTIENPVNRRRKIAFTATRWGTLFEPYADWLDRPPTASDCYRYCLAEPPVQVLTAPRAVAGRKPSRLPRPGTLL